MKKTIFSIGLLASSAFGGMTAPALADGEEEAASSGFSGYVTLTSDYRFRGISQSDNSPALQLGVDYNHESGFFAGIWGSNVDFSPYGDLDTSIEIDFTVGYGAALSEFTDISLKAVYYLYPDYEALPGDPELNYWELIAGISRKFGGTVASLEVAWSPEYAGEVGQAWAVTGGLEVPLCDKLWFFDGGLSTSGHFGVQSFDEPLIPDYTFWDLGLTASLDSLDLDVRYVDTDLDDTDCGLDICESGFVFSATVSFGG